MSALNSLSFPFLPALAFAPALALPSALCPLPSVLGPRILLNYTMHELLLFASVPSHQHHDLLQQLAGLTAMQPLHQLDRRLIWKAYRKPGLITSRSGASQDLQGLEMHRLNKMLNGGMFHTQVVGPVSHHDFGSTSSPPSPSQFQDIFMSGTGPAPAPASDEKIQPAYNYDNQPWRLEFRDIPEAGTRSALTTRLMANASLPKGDLLPLMNAWGYR